VKGRSGGRSHRRGFVHASMQWLCIAMVNRLLWLRKCVSESRLLRAVAARRSTAVSPRVHLLVGHLEVALALCAMMHVTGCTLYIVSRADAQRTGYWRVVWRRLEGRTWARTICTWSTGPW
jgi:hypothetical protein